MVNADFTNSSYNANIDKEVYFNGSYMINFFSFFEKEKQLDHKKLGL